MLEDWLNLQSKENLEEQGRQAHGWREVALCEEGHRYIFMMFCVSLALGTQVSAKAAGSVPGLSFVLCSGPWRPWCPSRPQRAEQLNLVWKQTNVSSSVLGKLSMERLKPWLDRCISLSWKAEPRRIKDWPIPAIVKNISSPGLAFVHFVLQLQNTDLSSVKANKQKIFTVLL